MTQRADPYCSVCLGGGWLVRPLLIDLSNAHDDRLVRCPQCMGEAPLPDPPAADYRGARTGRGQSWSRP